MSTPRKIIKRLIWALLLCFIIYLLACLLIPPIIGTRRKSDAALTLPAPAAERVCLIDDNDDALLWRLRLISSAQEEIILSTFDLRADNSGTDIIAALMDAAERGVQVRLIVDGVNAQLHLNGSDSFKALAAHENVQVKLYNPLRLTRLWTVNYRCHDKYLIVDRSAYLMGGRNTSDLFLGSGGTVRQNADRDLLVYGDASPDASVNRLLDYFDGIWALDTSRDFRANAEKRSLKTAAAALDERWAEIAAEGNISPIAWGNETIPARGVSVLSGDCRAWNKEPKLLNTLAMLMSGGKENSLLQSPYVICNEAMYAALARAANGDAELQIITNAPQTGANPWGCADYLNEQGQLLASGATVCEWTGEHSMHTKTILIDDSISIIGSFNWDMRSAYLDTEMMLLVDCPELNAALREETDEMISESKIVSPDGSISEGAEYIAPEISPLKTALQALLRVLIRPFRYLL